MMKKILFMLINMNIGGTEKALLNMISEMPRDKFDITILMLEEYGGFLKYIPNDVNIKYLKYYKEIKNIINNPPQYTAKSLIKKGRFIKGINILIMHIVSKIKDDRSIFFNYVLKNYPDIIDEYDIAVAYAGPMDFISYFIVNKVIAKKKLQWIHFDVNKVGLSKNFAENIYSKFDKIFVVSNEGKDKLLTLVPKLSKKIDTFFNIISSNLILKQANEEMVFDDNYNGIRILTVGRLTQEKGQDLCIKALKMLKNDGYKIRWYCIGDGTYRKKYEDIVKENELKEDFIFLGSKINPYKYMKNCDIYVQSSRHEGYCITLAEARCFNNPIITTNFTGANEQIKNEFNGLICGISEYEIYSNVKRLLDDKELYKFIQYNLSNEVVDSTNQIKKLDKLV
ncbi:glycosyltransferase [Clostridium perfringens]|nr:glycosyltransferase [Clostridium perfringens]